MVYGFACRRAGVLTTAWQPQDAIDFTDNDIRVLGNFPLSPRLRSLLLARNRVSSIQSTLPEAIPNLTSLVLTANTLTELADLDVLGGFKRLTHLVLMENPVTRKEVRDPQKRMRGSRPHVRGMGS